MADVVLFEACVDSVASARAAVSGGARRLELCESLVEGGVTPSAGKVAAVVRAAERVPVHVLIRPRPGDFVYSDDEMEIMIADIAQGKALGVAGIVSGVLMSDGSVDEARTRQLVEASRPLRFTFHRAIDAAADVLGAFSACLRLGVDYVLTSGGAATALEGAAVIRACVDSAWRHAASASAPGAVVVAGGGVSSAEIAAAIVRATGVSQLHGTARRLVPGASTFRRDPPVYMGGEKVNSPDVEYGLRVADASAVAAIVEGLRTASASGKEATSAVDAESSGSAASAGDA